GGTFDMVIRHLRRECGCLDHPSGWFYKDEIEHRKTVTLEPFAMKKTAVTNAEFLAFVNEAGYMPLDPQRFLAHRPEPDDAPGTHVSLSDARAYAAWRGERLPTEEQW